MNEENTSEHAFPTAVQSSGEVASFGPLTTNLEIPERALAIGAHPDDIEIWCGGTLAKWADSGCNLFHLILTDGSKGTWEPDQDVASQVAVRQEEQREAVRRLGGGEVGFLGRPDGELRNTIREQWEVCQWIRQVRPDVVLAHDPWRRYQLHPDHRHAGFVVTDSLVAARDPLYFTDQKLTPHRPHAVLLFDAEVVNHVEDVTGFESIKTEALLAHRSQYETTFDIAPMSIADAVSVESFSEEVKKKLSDHGQFAGFAAGESFHRLSV